MNQAAQYRIRNLIKKNYWIKIITINMIKTKLMKTYHITTEITALKYHLIKVLLVAIPIIIKKIKIRRVIKGEKIKKFINVQYAEQNL